MGKQVYLEDDVVAAIINKAIELDMVFNPLNDVLRVALGVTQRKKEDGSKNYPSSRKSEVQELLDGLKVTIFKISSRGMEYHPKNKRWVASPNVVTITVQDTRTKNLRITVYGKPHEFESVKGPLDVRNDMAGYSRFTLDSESQLKSAIAIINHAYQLKKVRGKI